MIAEWSGVCLVDIPMYQCRTCYASDKLHLDCSFMKMLPNFSLEFL